ncbi:MAG TPA: DsbA family protein [Paludibaculum sp.]
MSAKVEVLCFTDPYCSWCWATEPSLLVLRERYRDQVHVQFVMGGLVRDFSEFYDGLNDIGTPAEVIPHWRMVSERSGQPIDERFWADVTDPHFSTWPANIAAKAAAFQGEKVGDRYLRRLRLAVETERVQISQEPEQLRLAREVPGLDFDAFREELGSPRATRAFHEDLALCRAYGVSGFPAMLFRAVGAEGQSKTGSAVLVPGHRSLETYESVLAKVAPGLKRHKPRPLETLFVEYGPLTTRELAEITGKSTSEAERDLRKEQADGRLVATERRGGTLWSTPTNAMVEPALEAAHW